MRCPFCGNIDTQVKDSRPAEDHVSIRRRRFCPACGGRFTTYERVQLRDLVVIKKSGRREPFDRDKLERSIRIAMQKRPDRERADGPDGVGDRAPAGIARARPTCLRRRSAPSSWRRWPALTPSPMCASPSVYKNFQAADDFEDFVSELRPTAGGSRGGMTA